MISHQICPICESELKSNSTASQFAPFCSERCQQIDLFRWSQGRYAIVETIDGESEIEMDEEED